MMLMCTSMHIGNTYLNCFKFLLQLLVLVDKDFPLILIHLHLRLPICIQLVTGILRENDKAQDIRTHKYYATQLQYQIPNCKGSNR
jgi:hypothetical protein